jgi:cysteine-rich repeat protein
MACSPASRETSEANDRAVSQALQINAGIPTLSPGDVLAINFQDPASPVPPGYFKDFGEPFGVRTGPDQGGIAYGWVVPGTHDPLDLSVGGSTPGNGRNRGVPADPRLATFLHMQAADLPDAFDGTRQNGSFELSLDAGVYSVLVSLGDSILFDSSHGIDVEGVPAISAYTPSSSDPFRQQRVIVEVADGALTLTPTGQNTKIDFVDVQLASDATSGCGNGTLDTGEQCDDGNVSPGDGCEATCRIEGPCIPALSQFPGETLSVLPCQAVKIATPFAADFTGAGTFGIADGAGHPTGFSMVLPSTDGVGFIPQNVAVDVASGQLALTTTMGIDTGDANTQDNQLGVGLALPNGIFRIETTLVTPPAGSGQYEQAGLWFGISQADYLKLAVESTPAGDFIHALIEEGEVGTIFANLPLALPVDSVHLVLEADPALREVRAFARIGAGGDEVLVTTFSDVPDAWFSTDGAGIDFTVGTRSFAGIFATHRSRGPELGPLTYRFSDFVVNSFIETQPEPPPPPSNVDFERFSVPMLNPTALVWGPDGRLYVATVTGALHALSLDFDSGAVVGDAVTSVLQDRLVLGLTVDPDSTPDNVVLWAGHSDVQQASGDANSGMVSRLSGPGLAVREDIITGLPRAIANHSTNAVHFGPDGRLYIAQGGNTGAGSANDSISEFGPRPEQPLSAAILVADVKAPGFDGSCTPSDDPTGSIMDASGVASRDVPCDVAVYASGLRNSFDFTFSSSGQMYAVDNGLGVEGAHPVLSPDPLTWSPADGCEGPVLGLDNVEAHNPGTRSDLLYRIEPGGYYGHPNPSRDECVFYGANPSAEQDGPIAETGAATYFQEALTYPVGMQPDENFRPAMFSFGDHKSTNGILDYGSQAFCGGLAGDLLVNYYSGFDQIRRLALDPSGTRVLTDVTLRRSDVGSGGPAQLVDPLSMAQDPLGRIYVSEFGGGRITVFKPLGPSCWESSATAALPLALTDAGAAELGGKLYVVGGSSGNTPQRSLFVYDPNIDAWQREVDLPASAPAVDHPAVVAAAGRVYVIGGASTGSTSAVADVSAFDPATHTWAALAPLPAARAAATAQLLDGAIHVLGGSEQGTSRSEHFVYSISGDAWSLAAPLGAPREGHMSAVTAGQLFVLGGSRLTGAADDDATLDSVEAYDPASDTWAAAAPMLSPRRGGIATLARERVVVSGGEASAGQAATEVYDPAADSWSSLPAPPVARTGAVSGRLGNGVYVVGGKVGASGNPSSSVDAFHID